MHETLERPGIAFLLVLSRIGGMLIVAPAIGGRHLPLKLRGALALALTMAIFPAVASGAAPLPEGNGMLAAACLRETAVGLLLGLTAALVFAAFDLAGQLVGQQMGLSFASTVDPLSEGEGVLIDRFLGLLAAVVFLAAGGHRVLIAAIAASFEAVPAGAAAVGPGAGFALTDAFGRMFLLGVQAAAPVAVALLLVTAGFALLARAVPRMDVWGVSVPVQLAAGLAFLALLLPLFAELVRAVPDRIGDALAQVNHELGGAR